MAISLGPTFSIGSPTGLYKVIPGERVRCHVLNALRDPSSSLSSLILSQCSLVHSHRRVLLRTATTTQLLRSETVPTSPIRHLLPSIRQLHSLNLSDALRSHPATICESMCTLIVFAYSSVGPPLTRSSATTQPFCAMCLSSPRPSCMSRAQRAAFIRDVHRYVNFHDRPCFPNGACRHPSTRHAHQLTTSPSLRRPQPSSSQ